MNYDREKRGFRGLFSEANNIFPHYSLLVFAIVQFPFKFKPVKRYFKSIFDSFFAEFQLNLNPLEAQNLALFMAHLKLVYALNFHFSI